MIYVRRDSSIIPQGVLLVAERAQKALEETTDPEERRKLIKKKSHVWRAFARYLAQMSYGKCWYSESPDPQSFFDVDHFRPKLEAKRTDAETDKPGYEWLAFSWENFRYSANCSNRATTNHETGAVDGKASWFPLIDGSQKASWANRCEASEQPILLDPCSESDMRLLAVDVDGRIAPSRYAVGTSVERVTKSVELYGLNLPRLKGARKRVIRDVQRRVESLLDSLSAAGSPNCPVSVADKMNVGKDIEAIAELTLPSSPYSLAAKSTLLTLGHGELCAQPNASLESGEAVG